MRGLLLIWFFSLSAMSQTTLERSVCPNVTEDAKFLITSIQTLQDELRKSPECQAVSEKVSTIGKVLNNKKWKEVKELFKSEQSPSLEGADVEELGLLANEAAYALTDTIALLGGGSSNCMPQKNKASFLSTLSGITKEVATVVGNVTGPYGQAVALVGNLLSSAIAGVDKLYKQHKIYDFKQPAEEMLFMNQFCSFTQAQQDIADFLELEEKEIRLRQLELEYLRDSKVKDLIQNCPDCAAYKIAWDAKEKADIIINRIIDDANIVKVDLSPAARTTFTRCAEINRAVYSQDSDLNQFISLLKSYENPLMSSSDRNLIKDIVSAVGDLAFIYPRYHECIKMDNQNISIKFNDFIRDDVLTLNQTIFHQQMQTFQRQANKKYRDPNGDYMAKSLERMKWAKLERERVIKKLKEPNYQTSKQVVITQRNELRKRILTQLMPSYLKFRFRNNRKHINQFMRKFETFSHTEINYFSQKLSSPVSNLQELTVALKSERELALYFVSSYDEVFNKSKVIILEVANNLRYCNYLLYARSMVPENRKVCDQRIDNMNLAAEKFSNFDKDLQSILEFDKWADKNLHIQSTYVTDYSEHIRAWTERGDSRWDLIEN